MFTFEELMSQGTPWKSSCNKWLGFYDSSWWAVSMGIGSFLKFIQDYLVDA